MRNKVELSCGRLNFFAGSFFPAAGLVAAADTMRAEGVQTG
jgi:hypothetical protein